MKTICRTAALAACLLSFVSVAAPPPAAPKAAVAEYPLSCAAGSKALYSKARDALPNARTEEARALLIKLLAADPKCVMARATLGNLTPGVEGRTMVDEAIAATAGLSEIEKLELQALDAARKGDPERNLALRTQARDLAPTVYELNIAAIEAASGLQRWDLAVEAAKKATALNPKAGAGWNMLGYCYLGQHAYPDAVAAFRKYVELVPTESNPHDSLADALLANDQLDEAAAEYQKAIDVSGGQFWMSWHGIATVKALRNDWDGARAAVVMGQAAATVPQDKVELGWWLAWTWLAQGKPADAMKALDVVEKDATAAKMDGNVAWVAISRGTVMVHSGKPADALKHFAAAEKLKTDTFTAGQRRNLGAGRLVGLVEVHAPAGKTAEAEKALTALEALYKDTPGDPAGVDNIAYARGMIALHKKDAKGAVASFLKCTELNDLCRLRLAEAQEKAGDAAAASQTRTALIKANRRDPFYFWIRGRAEAALKAPVKKAAGESVKK